MKTVFYAICVSFCVLLSPLYSGAFCFEEAGKEYGISPALLEAIAKNESNLNPKAVNRNRNGTIDYGLMQINSSWLTPLRIAPQKLMSDPCYNTFVGARILKQCIDRHGLSWEAVGCYNAVDKRKRVNYTWKIHKNLSAITSETEKENGKPPSAAQLPAGGEGRNADSFLYFRVREAELK